MTELARVSPLKRRLAPPCPVRGGARLRRFCGWKCSGRRISALALQADVRAVTQSTMEQINVVAALGRHDLLCMMTRDARDVGLLVVDIGLLTALVELQALGQVTSVPAKERAPTRTDAVVVSDMLDKWMADVARAADEAGLAQMEPVPSHNHPRSLGPRLMPRRRPGRCFLHCSRGTRHLAGLPIYRATAGGRFAGLSQSAGPFRPSGGG